MLKKNADKSFEAIEIASPNGDRTQIKGKRTAGRLIMAKLEAFPMHCSDSFFASSG
jgi:hypothetical protein